MIEAGSAETGNARFGLGMFSGETHTISGNQKYAYTSTVRIDTPSMPAVTHYVTGRIEEQPDTFDQPLGTDPTATDRYELHRRGAGRIPRLTLPDRHHPRGQERTLRRLHHMARRGFIFGARYAIPPAQRFWDGREIPQLRAAVWPCSPASSQTPTSCRRRPWMGWRRRDVAVQGIRVVDVTYFETDLKNEIDDLFFPNFTRRCSTAPARASATASRSPPRFQVTKAYRSAAPTLTCGDRRRRTGGNPPAAAFGPHRL